MYKKLRARHREPVVSPRNYITEGELDYGMESLHSITELHYRIMLQNYIAESYHRTILQTYITELDQ